MGKDYGFQDNGTKERLRSLYDELFALYGAQGWWPLTLSASFLHPGQNRLAGYHPNDYTIPRNESEQLEICVGAILTQNTSWKNVTKALQDLSDQNLLSLSQLKTVDQQTLENAIRSAGYYRQKAGYLKNFTGLLEQHSLKELERLSTADARAKLLAVKGIGPETADCILLYALRHCSFVIDAYTHRFLVALGIAPEHYHYQRLQAMMMDSLPKDLHCYQEYHALFVQHGKQHYSTRPYGIDDPFLG